MKTAISATSIAAFKDGCDSGRLNTARAKVWNLLNKDNFFRFPYSAKDIAAKTHLPLSNVVARINELRYDYGLVKVENVYHNESFYRPIREGEQPDLRELTNDQKEIVRLQAEIDRLNAYINQLPKLI